MCDKCQDFRQAMRHLSERTKVLVNQWHAASSRLDESVTLAMALLAHTMNVISYEDHITEPQVKLFEEGHTLFDRALVRCMQELPQEEATEEESILVHHGVVLNRLAERMRDQIPYGEVVRVAEIDEKFN
jgi:hypothetical protein